MVKTPEDTGVIRIIIELEEENIVLNTMTKFHKVLIKTIRLRERASLGDAMTDVRTDRRTERCNTSLTLKTILVSH